MRRQAENVQREMARQFGRALIRRFWPLLAVIWAVGAGCGYVVAGLVLR